MALARALVMDPDVLLLDEPLSNLDAKLREEMRLELKELQQKTGVTIIFVTHDQLEAMVLSDRVVVMNAGIIQQIDPAWIAHVHLSDNLPDQTRVPLGKGAIDLRATLSALAPRYSGLVSLEGYVPGAW